MIERTIVIDGKKIKFKASGATPIFYRKLFQRDIFKDMSRLTEAAGENKEEARAATDDLEHIKESTMKIDDLSLFENVAYCMAKQADPDIPDTIEGFYDNFKMFSVYSVLPELIDMWCINQMTDIEAKKNFRQQQEK